MRRTLAAACLVALLGCATHMPTESLAYRPGTGTIQAVNPAPQPIIAAAGGSAPQTLYRLKIRMDDGSTQYIDTASPGFRRGNRIQLTEDRLLKQL